MRIAITADLHWGHSRGNQATLELRDFLAQNPPDLFLLGGDVGTGTHFLDCLKLFQDLPCPKAMVPGNHDLWVEFIDDRGNSLNLFEQYLPDQCLATNFHYLDRGPLLVPGTNLAVAGTVNWYDYSWSLERMQKEVPDWQWHLENKAFTRGRHNDGRFIRWPLDDVGFTRRVVQNLQNNLEKAFEQAEQVLVLTHHPAFYGLNFPRDSPPAGLDSLLWDALSGNRTLETLLEKFASRIPFVFSGHTHRARENRLGPIQGYNIGGDYHFKRLLILNWPEGAIEVFQFGNP